MKQKQSLHLDLRIFLTLLARLRRGASHSRSVRLNGEILVLGKENIPLIQKSEKACKNALLTLLKSFPVFREKTDIDQLVPRILIDILEAGEISPDLLNDLICKHIDERPNKLSEQVTKIEKLILDNYYRLHSATGASTGGELPVFREILTNWEKELYSDRWRKLPSISPIGIQKRVDLEKTYVELFIEKVVAFPQLTKKKSVEELAVNVNGGQKWINRDRIERILQGSWNRIVLVGEPGSGKSTSVKWLAQKIYNDQIRGWCIPIIIPLRDFAGFQDKFGFESLLTYLLINYTSSKATDVPSTLFPALIAELESLQRVGGVLEQILVILDGWDEIEPGPAKRKAYDAIAELNQYFRILVTTRPSGIPGQLQASNIFKLVGLDYYHIRKLIHRRCRQENLSMQAEEELLDKIDKLPKLYAIAYNPYLLTILIQAYIQDNEILDQISNKTTLFNFCIKLIGKEFTEKYQLFSEELKTAPFTKLAFELSFGLDFKRYDFDPIFLAELNLLEYFNKVMTKTRLLHYQFTRYTFIHNQFQEYFSAIYMGEQLSTRQLYELCKEHLFKLTYQEEFRFLSSYLPSHTVNHQVFRYAVEEGSQEEDLFGIIRCEVASLLAASGVHDGGLSLYGVDFRELLWEDIEWSNSSFWNNVHIGRINIERHANVLLALDPDFLLVKLAKTFSEADATDPLHMIVAERIYRLIPTKLRRQTHFDDLIKDTDYNFLLGVETRGSLSELDIEQMMALLTKDYDKSTREEKRYAIRQLSAVRYDPLVPVLIQLHENDQTIYQEIVEALGRYGGSEISDLLVESLLAAPNLSSEQAIRQDFENKLSILNVLKQDGFHILDISGQLQLIEYISANDYNNRNSSYAMEAIIGTSIPDYYQSKVILDVLMETEDNLIRRYALQVLAGNVHPRVKKELWIYLHSISDRTFCVSAIQLLINDTLPENLDWLIILLSDENIDWQERRFILTFLIRGCNKGYNSPLAKLKLQQLFHSDFDRISTGAIDLDRDLDLLELLSVVPSFSKQVLIALEENDLEWSFKQRAYKALTQNKIFSILPHLQREVTLYGLPTTKMNMPFVRSVFKNIAELSPNYILEFLRQFGENYPEQENLFYLYDKAMEVLYELSEERGWLIFEDRIEDANRQLVTKIQEQVEPENRKSDTEMLEVDYSRFWQHIATDITEKYGMGNPSAWSTDIIDMFLKESFEPIIEDYCKDKNKLRLCGSSLNIPSVQTFQRIFQGKYGGSTGKKTTRNQFAIYLGYDSLTHYIDTKMR